MDMSRRSLLKSVALGAVGAGLSSVPGISRAGPHSIRRSTQMLQPMNVSCPNSHNAFPCIYKRSGKTLVLLWRSGSDHSASKDGVVCRSMSFDNGVTWTAPQVVRRNPDYRDPSGCEIDGVEYMTWFGGNASSNALGAGVQREWWDYSRRIDTLVEGAITAPLVKLPDGRLGAAFYGRKLSEPVGMYTSWMGWSEDNGWSWTTNRIVNFIGANIPTPEPYLVVSGGLTCMFFRWGNNDGIGLAMSNDSGKTWTFGPQKILENASGRPTTIMTSTGRLVMIYREPSTKNAVLVHSVTGAYGLWSAPQTILTADTRAQPVGMTYASMVEISPGVLYVVSGMETADGKSNLYSGYVTVPA
jgi:hypothetical protein